MTATGELLNLPVAIPKRTLASAYSQPQRRGGERYLPVRTRTVYALPRRLPEAYRYDADGYTRIRPDKGNIIDLFA